MFVSFPLIDECLIRDRNDGPRILHLITLQNPIVELPLKNSKMSESEAKRIAELEELLIKKDAEIQSYRKSLQEMPDWSKVQGQICLRNQDSTCVLMQSYKPKNGHENGQFLALDLGGTNFRVVLMEIGECGKFEMDSEVYAISKDLMEGTGSALFDHIASCLANFPCRQKGLAVGELISWTKGFKCLGVEAILNDTTGCLMSCAWKNPKCRIGLIIGTGTNACYLEELDNVDLWDGDSNEPKHMIVNTEWGAFGDHGELDYIQTKWDKRVDEGSINPVNEGLIFNGCNTQSIFERGRFFTKYVSEIESDQDPSDEDCSSIRYVCEKVSRRAGFMVAAGIAALLKKMNYKDVVVAIDGSVFRFHPHFPNIMKSRISQLMDSVISEILQAIK
ncbi:HK [Lepeophtheirus salmonis]|uniref:Phosphotransferase n=1 Tax=Lepeophtheirus salmonis TaxID=72036 RepID=A0A7R8CAC6_LEPSM|nr:HK [Lepeophtheirus salmonis]CAF2749623.1 HK [Lepeophtheirus salmonis]